MCTKNGFLFHLFTTQNNWKPCLVISSDAGGLAWTWNPTVTVCNSVVTIYFVPPLLLHGQYEKRTNPPPLNTVLWEEFWWSSLTINSEWEQKFLSTPLLPGGSVAHCGNHLTIFISNKSQCFTTPEKRVSCLFQLGWLFAHSIASLTV